MHKFNVITAFCKGRGIGINNKLPWKYNRTDMNYFKKITGTTINPKAKNAVIMGNNTFKSMQGKLLSNRYNIVLSKTEENYENPFFCSTFHSALDRARHQKNIESIFVIGGEQVYEEALQNKAIDKIYVTEFPGEYPCDTFFPKIPEYMKLEKSQEKDNLCFKVYGNKIDYKSSEKQYLDALQDVLINGKETNDRTGVGTISLFSKHLRFPINLVSKNEYQIPILTTKKVYIRGVIEELLWFIRGSTNSKELEVNKVYIWKGNTSKDFLASRGLDHEEGQIGPGYGHQWVNWGGNWKTGKGGINQVEKVINTLKTNPTSRRILINAWNVSDLHKMALPPCHLMYMFKVSNGKLNCGMIMRSSDMFLGLPFNIMSTALLNILIAKCTNLIPGEITLTLNDAHIYSNHVEQVKKQLKREPLKMPTLKINQEFNCYQDLCNLTFNDFEILNYHHWSRISAEMAV